MNQLALAGFGLVAIWLAMSQNPVMRQWAPVVGLCGQPFWFHFALTADAWGLIVLVIAYTLVYVRGVWVQWWGVA